MGNAKSGQGRRSRKYLGSLSKIKSGIRKCFNATSDAFIPANISELARANGAMCRPVGINKLKVAPPSGSWRMEVSWNSVECVVCVYQSKGRRNKESCFTERTEYFRRNGRLYRKDECGEPSKGKPLKKKKPVSTQEDADGKQPPERNQKTTPAQRKPSGRKGNLVDLDALSPIGSAGRYNRFSLAGEAHKGKSSGENEPCGEQASPEDRRESPRKPVKVEPERNAVSYVNVADFVVKSHGYSCNHLQHEMEPVKASVTVIVGETRLEERTFRAFYCRQCEKYFVSEGEFERLTRRARLCCKVIALDEVVNPKKGRGLYAKYAEESLIHQYGYNVNEQDDPGPAGRRAILSFIIENGIMGQYQVIAFLENLIRSRTGMSNMQNAIAKWKSDVAFLNSYAPPKRTLKVGRMYAKKSKVRVDG